MQYLIYPWGTGFYFVQKHESEDGRSTRKFKMASTSLSSRPVVHGPCFLSEEDVPGNSLNGRKPVQLKNSELTFWLKCRGDSCKGLQTKALLVKRCVALYSSLLRRNRLSASDDSIYEYRCQYDREL